MFGKNVLFWVMTNNNVNFRFCTSAKVQEILLQNWGLAYIIVWKARIILFKICFRKACDVLYEIDTVLLTNIDNYFDWFLWHHAAETKLNQQTHKLLRWQFIPTHGITTPWMIYSQSVYYYVLRILRVFGNHELRSCSETTMQASIKLFHITTLYQLVEK